jgi:hypothetical protein
MSVGHFIKKNVNAFKYGQAFKKDLDSYNSKFMLILSLSSVVDELSAIL